MLTIKLPSSANAHLDLETLRQIIKMRYYLPHTWALPHFYFILWDSKNEQYKMSLSFMGQ